MIKRLLTLFKESSDSFDGQQEGEHVMLVLRHHRFVVLLPLSFLALALLVPFVAWDFVGAKLTANGFKELFYLASSFWYMGIWLSAFYYLTIYTLNVVVITDRRIIESEQYGFFDKKISELHAYRVQDVTVHIQGIVKTMLKFGDLVVQTAASEKQFVFHNIPDPEGVKDSIMKIVTAHQSHVGLS